MTELLVYFTADLVTPVKRLQAPNYKCRIFYWIVPRFWTFVGSRLATMGSRSFQIFGVKETKSVAREITLFTAVS